MKKNRIIIAFPYAGGSSMMYNKWKRENEYVNIKAIDYSGHGFRYQEKLNSTFDELVEDVYVRVLPEIVGYREVLLFGHSMGGLVAYKVAEKMERNKIEGTIRLAVSGSLPPEFYPTPAIKRMQDDVAVNQYIMDYNRISIKKMESKVFQDTIFPCIKNDFKILNNYLETDTSRVHMPIYCFYSQDDSLMDYENMEAWNKRSDSVHFIEMQGDHFYIEEDIQREHILTILLK